MLIGNLLESASRVSSPTSLPGTPFRHCSRTAPPFDTPRRTNLQNLYEAASNVAEKLLQGRRVALAFDPTQGRMDAFGRTLAYIEVPGLGDFGYTMIKRGHAAEYTYDTAYRRQRLYRAAERRAKAIGKPLWANCGGPNEPLNEPSPTPEPAPAPQPIYVSGGDPHGLDADGDGVACE